MTKRNLNSQDLDAWQSERTLDRMRTPARHAVAAWALAVALALAAVLGPPATREVSAGLIELRHDVLMLDRELDRASTRILSACRGVFPVSPSVVVALGSDQIERA